MKFCTVPDRRRIITIADLFSYKLRQYDYSLITVVSLAVCLRLIIDGGLPDGVTFLSRLWDTLFIL